MEELLLCVALLGTVNAAYSSDTRVFPVIHCMTPFPDTRAKSRQRRGDRPLCVSNGAQGFHISPPSTCAGCAASSIGRSPQKPGEKPARGMRGLAIASFSGGLNRGAVKVGTPRNAIQAGRDIPEITVRMLKAPPCGTSRRLRVDAGAPPRQASMPARR